MWRLLRTWSEALNPWCQTPAHLFWYCSTAQFGVGLFMLGSNSYYHWCMRSNMIPRSDTLLQMISIFIFNLVFVVHIALDHFRI